HRLLWHRGGDIAKHRVEGAPPGPPLGRIATSMTETPSRPAAPRRVTILGSTGSVGCNTVELVAADRGAYAVEALVAQRNVEKLAAQARQLGARLAVVADKTKYQALKALLQGSGVGAAGLAPTLAAVRQGTLVAFANKEVLVCAGALVTEEARRHGARLLPVDSEH